MDAVVRMPGIGRRLPPLRGRLPRRLAPVARRCAR